MTGNDRTRRFRTRRAVAPVLLAVAGLAAGGRPPADLSVADPRCEGLREAPQVDTPAPRLTRYQRVIVSVVPPESR
jgi:hypothetical protein